MYRNKSIGINAILIINLTVLLLFCLMADDQVKWLEIYGTVFGLTQGILILLNKKQSWFFYIAYIVSFTIMSWMFRLYGDVTENMVYLIMGFMGIVSWYKKNEDTAVTKPNNLTPRGWAISLATVFVVAVGMYIWLSYTDDPLPLLDATTTALGFVATYLMVKRYVQSWILWFIDDILMCIVYFLIPEQPLYLLGLNVIWTVMAVGSFLNWRKLSKEA